MFEVQQAYHITRRDYFAGIILREYMKSIFDANFKGKEYLPKKFKDIWDMAALFIEAGRTELDEKSESVEDNRERT